MLNIGKLAAGGQRYYLDTVASGIEDYYTGSGEAPGYWLGAGAADLGLDGAVEPEALRMVLGARDPASGQQLTRAAQRRVPGFDCALRAPKSVSLLYGLGDPNTARTVRQAHDDAVAAAVAYLEQHAGWSRRGTDGVERVPVDGFVAAAFGHRTSRAGDPLLHTHVLVANLGRAVDDRVWRTLDARKLYAHAKTAGFLYQAQLRAELTRRLGVEWGPVRNGCADLDGVPDEVIAAFSQRRAQIQAHLHARGQSSAAAAQVATLATRPAKPAPVQARRLRARWQARALAVGFGPQQVAALTHRRQLDPVDDQTVLEALAADDGLTAHASTFTRRDVLQALCGRLRDGADLADVQLLADRALADEGRAVRLLSADVVTSHDVIRRRDGRVVTADPDQARYCTPELLALEQRVITRAVARRHADVASVPEDTVQAALAARPSLTGEQAAMVRHLTTSGAGVQVVVGKAGAGKTFALDAARDAWSRAGHRVVGCALAARAAAELEAGAGIDSTTLDGLLAALGRPDRRWQLAAGSVVVVDEAAMAGTRKLARLLDHSEAAGVKVVLVGDHHQLPEIDAGGLFRGLAHRLPAIELRANRRQEQPWERQALDELRHGDPARAVAAYQRHGRVTVAPTADAARERLVADWYHSHAQGEQAVMLALRRADVDDLNRRARARLAAAGDLTGPEIQAGGRVFQAGDQVVCLRNDRRLGVRNGTRGTVSAVDAQQRTLTVKTRAGQRVGLPAGYLHAGHMAHGYAVTGHKAQGLTCDTTFVLGCDAVYREWGYTALSRGGRANRLYLVDGHAPAPSDDHTHGRAAARDPVSDLVRALEHQRGQSLAVDQASAADLDPTAARVARDRLRARILRDAPPPVDDRLRHLDQQRADARQQSLATAAQLQRARERLADLRGLRTLTQREQRRHTQATVARLDGDLQRWQQRLRELDDEHRRLCEQRQQRRDWTVQHAHDLAEYRHLDDTVQTAEGRAARRAELEQPPYIRAALGPRPDDLADRDTWRDAVEHIERYRTRWGITDPQRALGSPPQDLRQRLEHDQVAATIEVSRGLDRGDGVGRDAPDLALG